MGKVSQGLTTAKRDWRVKKVLANKYKKQLLKAMESLEDRLEVLEFCESILVDETDEEFKKEVIRHLERVDQFYLARRDPTTKT